MIPTHYIFPKRKLSRFIVTSAIISLRIVAIELVGFVVLAQAPATRGDNQETYIWRVSDDDSHFYLLGSIHVLRFSDYPLATIYDVAFDQVDSVTFEIDLDDVDEESLASLMASRATYVGSRNLRNDINAATYNKLRSYLQARGLLINDAFKPWFYVFLLSGFETEEGGLDQADGVDEHYFNRTRERNLPVSALETPGQQIDLLIDVLESQSASEVEEALNEIMDNPGILASESIELIEAWNSGDLKQMEALLDQGADSVELNRRLLDERNENWMPALVSYLNSNRKELVIVGAGHLIGSSGLLELLRNAGYQLEALPLPSWIEMSRSLLPDRFEFTISGNMGRRCTIERTTDLNNWTDVVGFDLTDEETKWQVETFQPRFYRAVLAEGN